MAGRAAGAACLLNDLRAALSAPATAPSIGCRSRWFRRRQRRSPKPLGALCNCQSLLQEPVIREEGGVAELLAPQHQCEARYFSRKMQEKTKTGRRARISTNAVRLRLPEQLEAFLWVATHAALQETAEQPGQRYLAAPPQPEQAPCAREARFSLCVST